MPEWCDNLLTVEGPEELVGRFAAAARGQPPRYRDPTPAAGSDGESPEPDSEAILCFHALCPVPDEVLRQGYEEAGYGWETEHWGCKWGACEQELRERSPGRASYHFDTPWDPPLPLFSRVSADWPGLAFTLRYHADWSGQQGVARWGRGKPLSHYKEWFTEEDLRVPEEEQARNEAVVCEDMAGRYRRAALSMPGGPAGETVPVFLLLQSAELLLRWRLAEAAGGPLPEGHRKGHRMGELLKALAAVPRWAGPAAAVPEGSRAWWAGVEEVDGHMAAFRFPCPGYDETDVPAVTRAAAGLPPAATGRRFWRECVLLWDLFGGCDEVGGSP